MNLHIKRSFFSAFTIAALCLTSLAANEKRHATDGDGSDGGKTPEDQSNTAEDLKITQNIRRAIVTDETLTLAAKNVKIITDGGKVSLRGLVNSAEEKKKIEAVAKAVAGGGNVDSGLEVKKGN